MYNKIFMTWLIAAVNDIYSMSKTRSRVISPALAFQKQLLCSVLISTINLKKDNCVSPGKILSHALCAELVGNMSIWAGRWRHVVSFMASQCPSSLGGYLTTHTTSSQFCNSFHTSQVLTFLLSPSFTFHICWLCVWMFFLICPQQRYKFKSIGKMFR